MNSQSILQLLHKQSFTYHKTLLNWERIDWCPVDQVREIAYYIKSHLHDIFLAVTFTYRYPLLPSSFFTKHRPQTAALTCCLARR